MTLIGKESKSVLKGILVFFVVFLFLSSEQFSPLNPLVYKTKLWVEDTYIFGGIRISEEQGLSSYGNHSVGLLNDKKEGLTTQELDNNYYDYHLQINKDYLDGKLKLSDNPDIQFGYYDRNTGFTVRILPYIIYKTNIFDVLPSFYVENFYFTLTSLIFGFIINKIWQKEGFLVAILFAFSHFFYWIFIVHARSFATPYLICIIPFLIPFTKYSKYLYKKRFNFYFMTLVLLVPFLEHITVGYLHIVALLSGIYLNNDLKFLKKFIMANFFKLGVALVSSLLISQIIVVLQNYFFLGQSFGSTMQSHWYNLTKREDGTGVFSCFGESSYFDVVEMYLTSNIINLKIFELNYLNLTLISLIIYFAVKIFLKKIPPTSNELLILYLASLSLTILWFIITKSHALCHPHFQPMLFLYSSFPLITIYFGRIIRDTFDFYIKK